MKKLIKIIFSILCFFIIFILIDLYVFRGYFSNLYLTPFQNEYVKPKEIESDNLKLRIVKKNDIYEINFKNKTIKPFFLWTYRWNTYFPVNDSVFALHYRFNRSFPKYKEKYDYGLDCGTGAGTFTVNPLESFHKKLNYKQIINLVYWDYPHFQNKKNDTVMDLIYNKPLYIDNDKKIEILKRNDLTNKDSIDLRFYLPVFNYNHRNLMYVKSNNLKIAYTDIIENIVERKEKHLKGF